MPRVLLLLAATLLLLGLPSGFVAASVPSVAANDAVVLADDDCCPEQDPADEADCCTYDFGLCCAASVTALPSSASDSPTASLPGAEQRVVLPPDLLLPRTKGPPPTPPPIA